MHYSCVSGTLCKRPASDERLNLLTESSVLIASSLAFGDESGRTRFSSAAPGVCLQSLRACGPGRKTCAATLERNAGGNGVTGTAAGRTSDLPHPTNPVGSAPACAGPSLLRSRSPCQDFQAGSQSGGSGALEACSLVKYLSYVIDVSTVINLAAAHPSSRPVPAQLHGGLLRSCQTGPDEVCVRVCVRARLFVRALFLF